MNANRLLFETPARRVVTIASGVLVVDQITKWLVLRSLGLGEDKVIIPGFFRFVNWVNTGAAWSMFRGYNGLLAIIALAALVALYVSWLRFESRSLPGQIAFGLIFGGITGNLVDRLIRHHVVDFIYFYVQNRSGEHGFPAFNAADTAICTGVGLMLLITWRHEHLNRPQKAAEPQMKTDENG